MTNGTHGKSFYFVNKSEGSKHLSKSIAVEKSAIQRHVQTGLKRRRKTAQERSNAVSQGEQDGQATISSVRPDIADAVSGADGRTAHFPHATPSGSTNHKRCFTSLPDHGASDLQTALVLPANHSLLGKRDPFDACSVTIDQRVAGLIHYYLYYYHPSQWPNEMVLLQKGVYTFHSAILNIMRNAVADKLGMYCLLSAAACRLQFIDRLPCPPVVGIENAYMQTALQLMSSYVATANFADSKQWRHAMTSIGFLGSAEAYRGNVTGCRMHFDAQLRILEGIGGLSLMKDEYLRKHLAMADLFLACVDVQPCTFPPWYDPGPASLLCLRDEELDRSQSLSTANMLLEEANGLVPSTLHELIRQLKESHTVKSQIITSTMNPARAMQVTHWITLRNMAIRNNLLSLNLLDGREHALRIAIIMWTLLAMNVTGRAKTVKVMAGKLMGSLLLTPSSAWSPFHNIKLWIVLVGLYCSDEGSEEFEWLKKEALKLKPHKLLDYQASTSIDEKAQAYKEFQNGFFFDSKAQAARTWMLAQKLRDEAFDIHTAASESGDGMSTRLGELCPVRKVL